MRFAGRALLLAGVIFIPATAHAGMPDYSLSDIVSARLEVISFFLLVALVLGFVFQRCWNGLSRDFSWMPPLTYRKSLAVIFVASLFCGLILTMISGARELLTPGAWDRVGSVYKLHEPQREPMVWLDSARRRAMEHLRDALWDHARKHDGELPDDVFVTDMPPSVWRSPDPSGTPYSYVPRRNGKPDLTGTAKGPDARGYVLAYEPMTFGPERFVLLSTGEVIKLKTSELAERVKADGASLRRSEGVGPSNP